MNHKKRSYQKEMDAILERIKKSGHTPRLFLHSCCAPCSSYVLEYLSEYFEITDFFYNPNITDAAEYRKRSDELQRLIEKQPHRNAVTFIEGAYEPAAFYEAVRGFENCREGEERCARCFRLRLFEAAKMAKETGPYDYFTTTLTISPLKDARLLNETGEAASEVYGVPYLPCDFKKKGGYQRSIELSKEYDLYRQNYCGCIFSKRRDYAGHPA